MIGTHEATSPTSVTRAQTASGSNPTSIVRSIVPVDISAPQRRKDLAPEQLDAAEPTVEAQPQVEDEVFDADLLEAAGLLGDLGRVAGDQRSLDVLGGGERTRRRRHPPLPALVRPGDQPVDVEALPRP